MKNIVTDKPNVIFVLVDDMGYGDLSCFGQKAFSTPVLDRMASEGIRFNNFYCGSTVSAPSRASLLTGKHTGHTSVRGNSPAQLMGDEELTIAKVMKQAGYITGCIGKWGVGHPPPPDDPERKGFAAMMRNIDNSMGMIFAKLKDLGIDEKTMVIFCSDNGPHQEGGHMMEFFNSNGDWRGMKRDMYEGGVRTPFIARWPGVIKPNSVSDHIAAFWDVLPTFCEITGIKKPSDTDGISFLPAMLGKKQAETHDYLYWELFEQGGKQAILKGDWKAIRLNVRGKEEQRVTELYNIKTDPEETKNVADENQVLVRQFNELFISARTEFNITPLFYDDNKKVETPF